MTIGGYETNTQFVNLYKNGSRSNGINYSNTHLYLELWTCDPNFFTRRDQSKKKKVVFDNLDKIRVARIELFTDFKTLADPDNLYQVEYDGDGHIRNWGPGILKNYIQTLTSFLNKTEARKLYDEILNPAEIKNLKKETLFVPDYTLYKFNKFNGDESKRHDEKELFSDYKYNYKLLTTDELNQNILKGDGAFYYLIYIKSSTDKFLSVINSNTGEIIYSKYSPVSYNIKSGDLKDLYDKIR